jgi:hypothetical protein
VSPPGRSRCLGTGESAQRGEQQEVAVELRFLVDRLLPLEHQRLGVGVRGAGPCLGAQVVGDLGGLRGRPPGDRLIDVDETT